MLSDTAAAAFALHVRMREAKRRVPTWARMAPTPTPTPRSRSCTRPARIFVGRGGVRAHHRASTCGTERAARGADQGGPSALPVSPRVGVPTWARARPSPTERRGAQAGQIVAGHGRDSVRAARPHAGGDAACPRGHAWRQRQRQRRGREAALVQLGFSLDTAASGLTTARAHVETERAARGADQGGPSALPASPRVGVPTWARARPSPTERRGAQAGQIVVGHGRGSVRAARPHAGGDAACPRGHA
jgi:hypothetical protein